MIGDQNAIATIPVKDADRARAFYEGVLGLTFEDGRPGAATYRSGEAKVVIYTSDHAGTNQATAVTWAIPDIDQAVRDLKAKGVAFEHYPDMPNTVIEDDVHVSGDMRVAWLKDPDGNILCLYGV